MSTEFDPNTYFLQSRQVVLKEVRWEEKSDSGHPKITLVVPIPVPQGTPYNEALVVSYEGDPEAYEAMYKELSVRLLHGMNLLWVRQVSYHRGADSRDGQRVVLIADADIWSPEAREKISRAVRLGVKIRQSLAFLGGCFFGACLGYLCSRRS